jgi:hypothetical protein
VKYNKAVNNVTNHIEIDGHLSEGALNILHHFLKGMDADKMTRILVRDPYITDGANGVKCTRGNICDPIMGHLVVITGHEILYEEDYHARVFQVAMDITASNEIRDSRLLVLADRKVGHDEVIEDVRTELDELAPTVLRKFLTKTVGSTAL